MEMYRIAGKKAAALLDPFAVPMNAFIIGVQHDKCGNINDLYVHSRFHSATRTV